MAGLPEMTREISGRTYVLAANPLGIDALTLEFGEGDEGRTQSVLSGSEGPQL